MGEKWDQLERIALSQKFWSGKKFGLGDHNFWKISPTRLLFSQNVGSAPDNGPDAHTFI